MTLTFVKPKRSDTPRLIEIALAAKRHWGYSEAWMQQWKEHDLEC